MSAAESFWPLIKRATVQTCIVHPIRHSLAYAGWKERKALASALRAIYQAPTETAAATGWTPPRRARGPEVPRDRAFVALGVGPGGAVLRVLGADPAGDLHHQRDREPEQHGAPCDPDAGALPELPNDREASKLIYLALPRVGSKWRRPPAFWQTARSEFSLILGDRFAVEAS